MVLHITIIIMAGVIIITINRLVFQINSEGWSAYWVGIPAFLFLIDGEGIEWIVLYKNEKLSVQRNGELSKFFSRLLL